MSGSGPGPGPRALPSWQLEILERKRAKLAAQGAGPRPGPAERARAAPEGERMVLAESLGPLRDNPFMRLESERRRLRHGPPRTGRPSPGPGPAARPLQQLLELYSAVPGIRTIRADNILIIESQPDASGCFGGGERAWEAPAPASPGGRDPLRELLAGPGPAVAEIRAAQVFIYEAAEGAEPPPAAQPGTVSRLLQKFDQRPRPRRRRAGDLAAPASAPEPPPSPAAPEPPLSPATPGSPPPRCFLHKIGSNSFTVTPRGRPPVLLANGPSEPSPRAHVPVAKVPPVPSPSAPIARAKMQRPKPEGAEGTQSTRPCASLAPSSATPGALQPLSASAPKASSGSFEIRPSPKPDLAAIPAHDLQAQALANLRLNSRNSFLVVPSRAKAPCPPAPAESLRTGIPLSSEPERGQQEEPSPAAFEAQREPVTPPKASPEPLVPVTYIDDDIVEPEPGDLASVPGAAAETKDLLVPRDAASGMGTEMEVSAVPFYQPHPASPGFAQRGGYTFTVVPKRKPPVSGLATFTDGSRVQQNEGVEDEEIRGRPKPCRSADASSPGPLLKTRYPKAHEIEVIGGYLSLERSCISKKGSRRKKVSCPAALSEK